MKFNFEYWMQLQRSDPDMFEIERQRIIDHFIESTGHTNNRKLHGLQFKIDAERSRSTNPLGACIRLNQMLLDHVFNPHDIPVKTSQAGCQKNIILKFKRKTNEKESTSYRY